MPQNDHLLAYATFVPSPNHDERPGGEMSLVVIHGISLPRGQYGGAEVIDLFCNQLDCAQHPTFQDLEGVRVSSHLYIRRDGELLQFVPFDRRAWHAGESSHEGRSGCNDFAIGIELEGTDDEPYTDAQYAQLERVCRDLSAHYGITAVVGHSDIAPGRKTDPGPHFDWPRLRAALS